MPPSARVPNTERAARRDDIVRRLFVAVETLLKQGIPFAQMSVEQIIREADIARSTFYKYFEDKGVLVIALMDAVTQAIGDAAVDWFTLPPKATRADLAHALARLCAAYREHGPMLSAVIEAAAYDQRVGNQYAAVLRKRFEDMNAYFIPQQEAGLIRQDITVAEVTPWLAWMFERGLYHLVGSGDDIRDPALEAVTTIIWQTLYEGTR
jgi:TetR/AcrR family transcriptional regulator, ethionamide resistance regulator